MNKRRIGVILCLIAVTTAALALGSQATKNQSPPPTADAATMTQPTYLNKNSATASQSTPVIPQQVIYGVLFRELAAFKKKADEKEKNGEDASDIRNYHKRRARLDDQQMAALERVADDVNRETDKLDAKAKKIIEADRARHPKGQLKTGEALPTPPDALKTLGQQRKSLILQGREQLRLKLGDAEFQRFEQFVQQDIGSRIKPVKPGESLHSSTTPTQPGGKSQ